jgi:hypothetical protein
MEKQGIPSGNLISLSFHSATTLAASFFTLFLQEEKQTAIDAMAIKRGIIMFIRLIKIITQSYFYLIPQIE